MVIESAPVNKSPSTASKKALQQNGAEKLWISLDDRATDFSGVITDFPVKDFGGVLVEPPPLESDSV